MRILLLGGDEGTCALVEELIGNSEHSLEWRRTAEREGLDHCGSDLLLIAGAALWHEAGRRERACRKRQARPGDGAVLLLERSRRPQERGLAAPTLGCSMVTSENKGLEIRCALHQQACRDYQTRLIETVARPTCEPVTFEYQG